MESPTAQRQKSERCVRSGVGLTWRDFADGGRMPAVALVTVGALNKYGAITETLGKHFSSDVIQSHSAAWSKTVTTNTSLET